MGYSYKIIPEENLVKNTITNALSFDEYVALMESILNDECFRPSMNMFWDFRQGTLSGFSSQDIERIKYYIGSNRERRGADYRVAFLVNKDVDYGLSRMYQAISDDLPVYFMVFTDEKEALEWINHPAG